MPFPKVSAGGNITSAGPSFDHHVPLGANVLMGVHVEDAMKRYRAHSTRTIDFSIQVYDLCTTLGQSGWLAMDLNQSDIARAEEVRQQF